MITALIFRDRTTDSLIFHFLLLSFESNILETPSEIKRHMSVSIILKAFLNYISVRIPYDRETILPEDSTGEGGFHFIHYTKDCSCHLWVQWKLPWDIHICFQVGLQNRKPAICIYTLCFQRMPNYFRSLFLPLLSTPGRLKYFVFK